MAIYIPASSSYRSGGRFFRRMAQVSVWPPEAASCLRVPMPACYGNQKDLGPTGRERWERAVVAAGSGSYVQYILAC